MWNDLMRIEKRLRELAVEGKKAVHEEGCENYQECPLKCGPECYQNLDLHTAMYWVVSHEIIPDFLFSTSRLHDLTEEEITMARTIDIMIEINFLKHQLDALRRTVGLHEDKYSKLSHWLDEVQATFESVETWITFEIERR